MDEGKVLEGIGLGQKEAKVYIALLARSSSTASQIAEATGIDRTVTYAVLARLIERGITSYVIRNNVKYFKAASPEQLLHDLKEREKRLQEIMPKLLALSAKEKEDTVVEIFKGKEGIITVLKTILRDKGNYIFIGGAQELCRIIPVFMRQFLRECHATGIRGTLICEQGFGDNPDDMIGKNETYRLASKNLISTSIKVWKNKTAFFIFTEPCHAIMIQSKEVADRHRLFFTYLWKQAKEPGKHHKAKTFLK
jgi:sugar-specific transcriptional regulator TrmB